MGGADRSTRVAGALPHGRWLWLGVGLQHSYRGRPIRAGSERGSAARDLAGPGRRENATGRMVHRWIDTIDVEIRTEENYRRCLRLHVLPRWGHLGLGEITASAVTEWLKQLRQRYAASTVVTLRTILSMILDDAVDERLIPANPVRRRRRRGRRRDRTASPCERVWAMPEHVLRIAEQASMLGGPSAGLLVITTAWTGCRLARWQGCNATKWTSTAGQSRSTRTSERCTSPRTNSGWDRRRHQHQPAPSPCRHSWPPNFVTISPAHLTAECSGRLSMATTAKAPIRCGPG